MAFRHLFAFQKSRRNTFGNIRMVFEFLMSYDLEKVESLKNHGGKNSTYPYEIQEIYGKSLGSSVQARRELQPRL